MARARLQVTPRDGGIGFVGPGTRAVRAAIGVSSIVPTDAVVLTSPSDGARRLGIGPLRDACVLDLDRSGGTVVAKAIARTAGGTPINAGTDVYSGSLRVTPEVGGHALGSQLVILECVTGGAAGTAVFRLIVDGTPAPQFTPAAGDIGTAGYQIPAANLGSLALGVDRADQLQITLALNTIPANTVLDGAATAGATSLTADGSTAAIGEGARFTLGGTTYTVTADVAAAATVTDDRTIPITPALAADANDGDALTPLTDFVAEERIQFRMSTPTGANGDLTAGITSIVDHEQPWRSVQAAGVVTGPAWAALETAVRALWAQGKYAFCGVQLAGPDIRTGAGADQTTAAWTSGLLSGVTGAPARYMSPVTMPVVSWATVDDPVSKQVVVQPGLYATMAAIHARRSWEPPDAVKYGRLKNVRSIYPSDMSLDQINSLDDFYYTTLCTYGGRRGVYITHARLWGQPPGSGITATDYTGVERRRVMDEACASVREALWPFTNDTIVTNRAGYMAQSAQDHWRTIGNGALDNLLQLGAITFGETVVTDPPPGVVRTGRVTVTVRISPLAKAEIIEADLVFYVAPESAVEEAA